MKYTITKTTVISDAEADTFEDLGSVAAAFSVPVGIWDVEGIDYLFTPDMDVLVHRENTGKSASSAK